MTGPRAQDRAARGIPRWLRQIRGRLVAAGLTVALAAALAIPALTFAGGTAMAAAPAGHAADATNAARASAGRPAAAGITAAGTGSKHLLAWGFGGAGQLGDGSTSSEDTPVAANLPAGTKVTQVRAGCFHTLALTSKGHVLAWGLNEFGQLGNATTTNSSTPVRVLLPAGSKVTTMTAGDDFALAGTSGGGLFAWGANNLGQFGDGTTTSSDTPVEVFILIRGPSIGHLVSLAAGADHTLALFSSGALLAWGGNGQGELGNGTTTSSDTPVGVLLPAGAQVTAIRGGEFDSMALTAKGHVLTWGYGADGELGDGSTMNSDTPVRVALPSGWRALEVGSGPLARHMLAIVRKKS